MDGFNWIMSDGGPLICIEAPLVASWGGGDRLSVKHSGAATDYDRACEGSSEALTCGPLERGAALFLQGPHDTSFWRRSSDGKVFIVRIEACELDTDFDVVMDDLDEKIFDDPIETMFFIFRNGNIQLFDSAYNGKEQKPRTVDYEIDIGTYKILTSILETREYCLWLHRFDKQR